MPDIGHMNFFNVNFCGLYKINSPETYGCELDETFTLIGDWAKNRTLSATIPWDPAEAKKNRPKCYCKDIFKDEQSGDFFLVLWKSDTDSTGTMWGAQEDNKTGTGKVVKYTNAHKGKPVIWGRPCYYWVVPEFNTVISIKFEHSITDAQMFEDYVVSCINNRVTHDKRKKELTDTGQVRISYMNNEGTRFRYRFKKSLLSAHTSSVILRDLAASVTHIVKRETILVNAKNERAEWLKKFTELVPFVSSKPNSRSRQIEVKAEAKPTIAEIREIIETYAVEDRRQTDWDNVGFETGNGVTWVDKYRLKEQISVKRKTDSVLNAYSDPIWPPILEVSGHSF